MFNNNINRQENTEKACMETPLFKYAFPQQAYSLSVTVRYLVIQISICHACESRQGEQSVEDKCMQKIII